LKEYTHSSKASRARPTGPLARPHETSRQPGGKKVPSAKRQHLQDPNGYLRKCSGATVGNSHRGPLRNRGETHLLSQKTKHKRIHKPKNTLKTITAQWQGPTALTAPAAHQNSQTSRPQAKLRFARGAQRRTNETPPGSRAGRPHG
jgi:hypothetical protein